MNKNYRQKAVVIFLSLTLLLVSVVVVSAHRSAPQRVDVFTFADIRDVGEATLHRNQWGISARARVQGLDPGVYTLWWVVWNTPQGCATAWVCVEADLFNPDAGLAIGYAAGRVVRANGRLQMAARLQEGESLNGFPYPEFQALGLELNETTLIAAQQAEVHLVWRYHGPVVPGLVGAALHSFNGACIYDAIIAGSEPTYGLPGPNSCVDTHFSVFPSPAAP